MSAFDYLTLLVHSFPLLLCQLGIRDANFFNFLYHLDPYKKVLN